MGNIARNVEDVILGEAKGGSFEDMVAIASVIANRAASLETDPEDIVSKNSEFNAYGKALPAGSEKYRDMAKAAIDYVEKNGPVTDATFYATPSAANNLPSGLALSTTTAGHQFYTDPQNRAINTAVGYRDPVSFSAPEISAIPEARPDFNSVPTYDSMMVAASDPSPRQAPIDFNPPEAAIRNQPVQGALTDVVGQSVSRLGPGYGWSTVSGGQPVGGIQGISRTGSTRHNNGWAIDGAITRDGQRLNPVTDRQDYMNLMTNLAEDGIGGLGHYGWGIHADLMSPNAWGPDTHTATLDPGFGDAIYQGRELAHLDRNYPTPYGPEDSQSLSAPELTAYTSEPMDESPFNTVMDSPDAGTEYHQAPTYSQADMTANGKNSRGPQLDYGQFSANPSFQAPAQPSVDETTSQLANTEAPSLSAPAMSMADQYGQYGLGRQALEAAIAPTVANLNLADDVTASNPGRVTAPVAPTITDPAATATVSQPLSAPEQQPSGTAHTSRSTARSTQADSENRQNAWSDTKKLGSLQQQDKVMGGIAKVLGGLLGGALLGPVGGIIGAVAAPSLLSPLTNQAGRFYPTAPVNPTGDRKGYGYGSLSDNGRSAYESSGQFRGAVNDVDSGKSQGGLW